MILIENYQGKSDIEKIPSNLILKLNAKQISTNNSLIYFSAKAVRYMIIKIALILRNSVKN